MQSKKKSRPVITKIKLNPEQAVLACCEQGGAKPKIAGGIQCASTGGQPCAWDHSSIVT